MSEPRLSAINRNSFRLADEPVAGPGHGFDESGVDGGVAKGFFGSSLYR